MSEPAKKPGQQPESYQPRKPEIVSLAAQAQENLTAPEEGPTENVLRGIPQMRYGDPSAVCYIGCVKRLMDYLRDPVEDDELFALSGAGLCFPWQYKSCCDEISIIPEIPQRTFAALGYESEYYYEPDITADARTYSKAFYTEKIKLSIDSSRPVIGFGFTADVFTCLITGYYNGGDGLYMRAFWSPEGKPEGYDGEEKYYSVDDWYGKCHGVVVVGEKTRERLAGEKAYAYIQETAAIFGEMASAPSEGQTIHTGFSAFDAMTAWLLDDSKWDKPQGKKGLDSCEVFLKPAGILLLQYYRDHLRLYLEKLSQQNPGLVHPAIGPAIHRMGEMVSGKERSDWLLGKAVDRRLRKFSNMRKRELREKVAACVAQLKEIDREIFGCLLGTESYQPRKPDIVNMAAQAQAQNRDMQKLPRRYRIKPKEKIAAYSGDKWPFSNVLSAMLQAAGLLYGRTDQHNDVEYSIQNVLTGEAFGLLYAPDAAWPRSLGQEVYGLECARTENLAYAPAEMRKLAQSHVAGGNAVFFRRQGTDRGYLVYGYQRGGKQLLCCEFQDGNDWKNCSYDFAKPVVLKKWTRGVTDLLLFEPNGGKTSRKTAYRQALACGYRLMTLQSPDADMDIEKLSGAGQPLFDEWIRQLERANAENSESFYMTPAVFPCFIALYENRLHLWKFLKICSEMYGSAALARAAELCGQLKAIAAQAAAQTNEGSWEYDDMPETAGWDRYLLPRDTVPNERRIALLEKLRACRALELEVAADIKLFLEGM